MVHGGGDTVEVPKDVIEAAVKWAREAGGPAYSEFDEWCEPIATLASYVPGLGGD